MTGATPRVDIEFAHVYADQTFSPEHLESTSTAARLRAGFADHVVTTSLLVDDYNVDPRGFDLPLFLDAVAAAGEAPDSVCWESELVPAGLQLLDSLQNRRLQRSHERYAASRDRYACSLLTAAWYLTRLGCLTSPPGLAPPEAKRPADLIVNVLPSVYANVENDVRAIIAASPFATVVARIRTEFFVCNSALAPTHTASS